MMVRCTSRAVRCLRDLATRQVTGGVGGAIERNAGPGLLIPRCCCGGRSRASSRLQMPTQGAPPDALQSHPCLYIIVGQSGSMQAAAATTHAPAAARVGASRSRTPASFRCGGAHGCWTHQWVPHCCTAAALQPACTCLAPSQALGARPTPPQRPAGRSGAAAGDQPRRSTGGGSCWAAAAVACTSARQPGGHLCVCFVCCSALLVAAPLSSCWPPSGLLCCVAGSAAAGCPPCGAGQQQHRAGGDGSARGGVL